MINTEPLFLNERRRWKLLRGPGQAPLRKFLDFELPSPLSKVSESFTRDIDQIYLGKCFLLLKIFYYEKSDRFQ